MSSYSVLEKAGPAKVKLSSEIKAELKKTMKSNIHVIENIILFLKQKILTKQSALERENQKSIR